jgi:sugar/nucleoside kinase (ribokinase family)
MPDTEQDRGLDVVVVGNIGIDTNVYLPGEDIDWNREANFTHNLDYVGQAGGYASRGYARLGKRTAFIGHVGADASGRLIRETLAADGVDTRALFVDPAGTSRSVNIMYRDGRRKNFYDGKSHMSLRPDPDACRGVLAQARLAHFNLPNWARGLLPLARECGLVIACDLQDLTGLDDPYRQDFIRWADIVFFSAANQGDPAEMIETLLRQNPGQVIICGMGSRGCAMGTRAGGVRYEPPVEMDSPVVDTNGAGDGLAVGFLSSYVLDGYSPEDALRRGQISARHTCAQRASTDSLITRAELDARWAAWTGQG